MSGLCKFVAVARLGRDTDGEFKADKHCIISFAAANKGGTCARRLHTGRVVDGCMFVISFLLAGVSCSE
jgi:hypothetical protein